MQQYSFSTLEKIYLVLQKEFSTQLSRRSIQWCISDNIPDMIVADRLSIIRILINIIENSLKYGGDDLGRIEIGYRMTEELHILTITDDGQGLEPAEPEGLTFCVSLANNIVPKGVSKQA